jgi:hypothetical protein
VPWTGCYSWRCLATRTFRNPVTVREVVLCRLAGHRKHPAERRIYRQRGLAAVAEPLASLMRVRKAIMDARLGGVRHPPAKLAGRSCR